MHHANGRVAGIDVIDEDANSHEVKNFREVTAAHDHLLVNRPVVLRAPHDLGLNAIGLEGLAYLGLNFLQRSIT